MATRCEELALPLVVADAGGETAPPSLLDMGDVALVLGGEAAGARSEWSGVADLRVAIPHAVAVESLNVASAAAVLLFRRIWKG